MSDRLKSKVALVYGAGSIGPGWGNGKAAAVAYAREGARVVAVDIKLEAAEETAAIIRDEGGHCHAVAADVTRPEQVKAAVDHCLDLYSRIDILHNNIGYAHIGGPVEMSGDTWIDAMKLNVDPLFWTCKFVLPVMEAQGSGSIINISSIASVRWVGTAYVGYAAFKAAVNQFTQAIALQYARKGIRANAILVGMMNTPVIRSVLMPLYDDEHAMVAARNAACPTGSMGDAWDVAWASVFLASDEAKYITGVLLPVDGGMSCKSA
jgi:NAD(P)-dependent dehydrogenase (short-subunit alcohol dehydrogenase family)